MFLTISGHHSLLHTTLKFLNTAHLHTPTRKLLEITHLKTRLVIRKCPRQGLLNAEEQLGTNMAAEVVAPVNPQLV